MCASIHHTSDHYVHPNIGIHHFLALHLPQDKEGRRELGSRLSIYPGGGGSPLRWRGRAAGTSYSYPKIGMEQWTNATQKSGICGIDEPKIRVSCQWTKEIIEKKVLTNEKYPKIRKISCTRTWPNSQKSTHWFTWYKSSHVRACVRVSFQEGYASSGSRPENDQLCYFDFLSIFAEIRSS